ncbi:FtsW/RodA/SpoVE family cell cycle protein [Mesobacillus foraminis]|uniref:Rod shape determining protein RodA n=1 Tax=Mesobacillus foraminis TaxID=279826 RepID=A0A4R2AVN3_9BACI|nr:FtsW/RodA/SpoVE family cell cycle protein [Mesobacillus foraminis]TCN18018.1 rod shape determining protein RodA [Mesobacillus foraminis]
MDKPDKKSDKFDWTLTLILLILFLVSCAAIYSAQNTGQYEENFLFKQIFWYVVGAGIISVTMFFDSEDFQKLAWIFYGFGVLLLVALFLAPSGIAPYINGAKSWFVIEPIGSIQPSEFMKIFLIIALSRAIVSHNQHTDVKTIKSDLSLFLKLGLITALPLGLIMLQPDLGTALVVLSIFTGLILVSGISWKIILLVYGSGAALGSWLIYMVIWKPEFLQKYLHVKTYQFGRIYAWLDPESYQDSTGYHLVKSLMAIGSGTIMGKGPGERQVYLPESHTDFIFSVIGEEYGFIGGSIVICIFFMLIYHLTRTALDTLEPFNTYICTGVISMITFHVFQNIGMTIQVLPITGIPLPFISYGGSSLMGNMLAMGLIYSIRFHHRTYMFSSGPGPRRQFNPGKGFGA